jgi:8-oxo-dGTP diphosphatase
MIEVSCAVIRNDELSVLVVQRGPNSDHPYKWEFPGGKVDMGETAEDSVIREVAEELKMDIIIAGTMGSVEHDYGHKQIRLLPFVCDTLDEKPVLTEHIAWRWVTVGELAAVELSEADVFVANDYVKRVGKNHQPIADVGAEEAIASAAGGMETVSDDELKAMVYRMMGSAEVGWIAESAASNPLLFRKLLDFTDDIDQRIVFRSSWALTKVCDKNPELFGPYLSIIADKLLVGTNESAVRSFLKILTLTGTSSLGDTGRGRIADHCFTLLRSRESAVAVKVYAMDVLNEISGDYPDLTHELASVLSMLPDDVPAGIKSKSRALLKRLGSTGK